VLRLARRKAALVYPVPPAPSTAVLVPWIRPRGAVCVFRDGWDEAAVAYRPAAIAGTWPCLEALLTERIDSLTHAVIVFARPGDELLTAEQRQRLWIAFRVPVFQQIIGANGVLLAAECEAHAGLHIESPKFDPGSRPIETAPCGCGRVGLRLMPVERIQEQRAAAASGKGAR
jgi:hypothetical protein